MNKTYSLFLLIVLGFGTAHVRGEEPTPHVLTPDDQKNHSELIKRLSPEQVKAVSAVYPNFRVLRLCSGRFSGGDRDEVVLGIWQPMESKDRWKREVHRAGLIWNGKAWELHSIDDEIGKDKKISGSFPMVWQYSFGNKGFIGEMKCGIESEFGRDSNLTVDLGDKPIFDLKKNGLQNNKVVCFATSDVYNNWDCVVYSPKDSRFRLWFQQAHAD